SLDQDRARQLFEETGLTSFRMMVTDHDWVQQVSPIIQESLTEVGITVDFDQRQSADVYNTIDGNPESFDVVIAPGDPSVFGDDPDLLMRWWYGNATWTDQRMNWEGTESYEQVQDLLDQGLQALDETEQQEIWGQLFDLLSEEVPLYPLFHRRVPTAWNAETLVDFQPISLTGQSFVDVASTECPSRCPVQPPSALCRAPALALSLRPAASSAHRPHDPLPADPAPWRDWRSCSGGARVPSHPPDRAPTRRAAADGHRRHAA